MEPISKHSRMICNDCHGLFDYDTATVVHTKLFGIDITEKRCPYCQGKFRAVELPRELDSYLFVNQDDRYYSYSDNK